MIKYASFFCGAGGADIGMQAEKLQLVFANDNWQDACDTFSVNHSFCPWDYAIQYVTPDLVPDCDVFIGGPPCQSFSNAKTREGFRSCKGLDNVHAYYDLVRAKQPKIVICETAPTIMDATMSGAYNVFFNELQAAGYQVNVYKLNACDYGIPQQRERFFFCAVRNDLGKKFPRPKKDHFGAYYSGWADYLGIEEDYILMRRGSNTFGVQADKPAYTVIATEVMAIRRGGPVNYHKKRSIFASERGSFDQRYLTVTEMAKLQGFPQEYYFCGSSKSVYKQIGNAWCTCVARAIARTIKEVLCL